MDLLRDSSSPSSTDLESPLYLPINNSLLTNSVDIELWKAEAKERMKEMLRESKELCRKLNFDSERAMESKEDISVDPNLIGQKRTQGCCPSKLQQDVCNFISSDGLVNEKDYCLTSKIFPVGAAAQSSVVERVDKKLGFTRMFKFFRYTREKKRKIESQRKQMIRIASSGSFKTTMLATMLSSNNN